MVAMSTYHATAELDGRYWLIHVEEVDRWTQARHLREVEAMARDLVAVMLDVDADAFVLDLDVRLPAAVQEHLDAAKRLRDEAAHANSASAVEVRLAARALVDASVPLRDVGKLLGVSHQRAHQLVTD
jgi:hypothetical protein